MSFDFTGRKVDHLRRQPRHRPGHCDGDGGEAVLMSRSARAVRRHWRQTRAEIAAFGHKAHAKSVDLGNEAAIKDYIAEAAAELGGIDVLVNNASAFGSADDEAAWVASLAIDMLAIVHATQAALPFLQEAKGAWSTRRRFRHCVRPRGSRHTARSRQR